ncbi:MAG: reverse transcriptase domain-containing protein [Gammaproteobacteria bacterium]|nr:reverse transcriptase domain-containing protein [Gammaproteobacteria bacterium]
MKRRPELFDMVAVTVPTEAQDVQVGDVGTVVELLPPDGVEVEFLTTDGRTRHVGSFPVHDVLTLNHVRNEAAVDADRIGGAALKWARKHILSFGDTDLLPGSFEYRALTGPVWQETYRHLCETDLASHIPRPLQRYLVPKPMGGFRVAHRLDPIDAILYSAAAYEISSTIESSRVGVGRRVACSYRVVATDDGHLFARDSGWNDYWERSVDLAKRHAFALETDIADFYGSVSHEGLGHALCEAGVPERRVASLRRFLGAESLGAAEGLPVGPTASHLLAEACLTRVDRMLLEKGYAFSRYVDDYRVSVDDRGAAVSAELALTEYLRQAYGLAIRDSKTTVRGTTELLGRRLVHPEREADEERERSVQRFITDLRDEGYGADATDLANDHAGQTICRDLVELVGEAIDSEPIRFGTIRHALRRARFLRTSALQTVVLENLRLLSPVLRDVCNYISATIPGNEGQARSVGDRLIDYATTSDYKDCPYVQLWTLHTLCECPAASTYETVASLAEKAEDGLGVRPRALAATAFGQPDWLREHKAAAMDFGPWDRRALIWAGQALPPKERRGWLGHLIEQANDPLDRAVAHHVLSIPA